MAKSRTYTVQNWGGIPTLSIRGKFLSSDFGMDIGTQLQLIKGKNMLILLTRKMNVEQPKSRLFTVYQGASSREDVPSLRIRGKFLANDFGIGAGTKLHLIEGKNMLILLKEPALETERNQNLQRLAVCEEEVEYLRSIL